MVGYLKKLTKLANLYSNQAKEKKGIQKLMKLEIKKRDTI